MAGHDQDQGDIAVAYVSHCLIAGVSPEASLLKRSLDHLSTYLHHPTMMHTETTIEKRIIETLRALDKKAGLLEKWAWCFNSDHFPKSADLARQFNREVSKAFTHFPESQVPLVCQHLKVQRHHSSDFAIEFPIAIEHCTLIFTTEGSATLRSVNGEASIHTQSVVIVPPTCRCSIFRLAEAERWEFYFSRFSLAPKLWYLSDWIERLDLPYVIDLTNEDFQLFLNTCTEMTHRLASRNTVEQQLSWNLIENLLLRVKLLAPAATGKGDPRVVQAANFILHHIGEPIQIETVADYVGLSAARLRTLFRNQMGTGVSEWRSNMRMEMATTMLEKTDLSIGEVAYRVGFDDQLYFSKRFNQLVGCSPTAFRTRARKSKSPRTLLK